MAIKNDVVNRVVAGLVISLMSVIAVVCLRGNAAVAEALNNHKDDDTPHAGIAENTIRFEMIEKQLATLQKGVDAILLREFP